MVSSRRPDRKSLVFAGTARLPSASAGNELLVIELEVNCAKFVVKAVHISPPYGALKGLLESALVGELMSTVAETGIDAISESYFSPYRNAARSALLKATEAFATFRKRQSPEDLRTHFQQVE